jgi:hypothetical protein
MRLDGDLVAKLDCHGTSAMPRSSAVTLRKTQTATQGSTSTA